MQHSLYSRCLSPITYAQHFFLHFLPLSAVYLSSWRNNGRVYNAIQFYSLQIKGHIGHTEQWIFYCYPLSFVCCCVFFLFASVSLQLRVSDVCRARLNMYGLWIVQLHITASNIFICLVDYDEAGGRYDVRGDKKNWSGQCSWIMMLRFQCVCVCVELNPSFRKWHLQCVLIS